MGTLGDGLWAFYSDVRSGPRQRYDGDCVLRVRSADLVSFLEYAAELHEQDGYNAIDITRGYFKVHAQLTDRVGVRFVPDVRPITDVVTPVTEHSRGLDGRWRQFLFHHRVEW